jgi:hypothetical protein
MPASPRDSTLPTSSDVRKPACFTYPLCSFILATSSIASFAADDVKRVSYKEMMQLNRDNAAKITKGMTKDEVVQIMGNIQSEVRDGPINNPWKIEIYGDLEILHYITDRHPPFMPIKAYQATPIVLKEDTVIGMGREVLKEIRASASPAPARPESTTEKSVEERLNTLKKLYDDGLIDKESYETHRTRILESL